MSQVRVNYHEYIASREWALKKRAVRERSGGICERCKRHPHQQTHHLTYERLGDERLEDLLGVCNGCHAFLSADSDVDPAVIVDPGPAPDDTLLIRDFIAKADTIGALPSDLEEFNFLIQNVIAAAHPNTGLKLAQIKLEANKRFVQRTKR